MKILTLNCQNGYHKNFNKFIEQLIYQHEYDAVLLQEVGNDTRELLEQQKHYRPLFLCEKEEYSRTVSVLVRHNSPLLDITRLYFPPNRQLTPSDYLFGALLVKIEYEGEKFVFGSLHMPAHLRWIDRARSSKKLSVVLKNVVHNESRFIIGGDWNSIFTFEHSITRVLLTQKEFHPVISTEPTYYTRRIEPGHFLNNLTKNFLYRIFPTEILDFFVTTERNYSTHIMPSIVSDHAPVVLTIHEEK